MRKVMDADRERGGEQSGRKKDDEHQEQENRL
jgi:hypothetical protein